MQWNVNGLRRKIHELQHVLRDLNVDVAALQETKVDGSTATRIPDYDCVSAPRTAHGGGLAFFIKRGLGYSKLVGAFSDGTTEIQALKFQFNGEPFTISNVYIPPVSSCPPSYNPTAALDHVARAAGANHLLCGDVNAHSHTWHSSHSDQRGMDVDDLLACHNLVAINSPAPTRLPTSGDPSSPDITAVSAQHAVDCSWYAVTTGSSDHLPLLTTIGGELDQQAPLRSASYINFRKADWPNFTETLEQLAARLPEPLTADSGERPFRLALLQASRLHIPVGRQKHFTAGLSTDILNDIKARDRLRLENHNDPRLPGLNDHISRRIAENKRALWRQAVDKIQGHRTGQLWRLLRRLNNRNDAPRSINLRSGDKEATTTRAQANMLNRLYAPPHTSDKLQRQVRRATNRQREPDHLTFTSDQVAGVAARAKSSSAIGPTGVCMLHLKHLGPIALKYLAKLFTLSLAQCRIPSAWKGALIIPLIKPNKPADDPASYRPISLLCPMGKLLEKLLLPHLAQAMQLHPSQHGFRKLHSTATALSTIAELVKKGLNAKKPACRTVMVALDLKAAFDTVDRSQLKQQINSLHLHGDVKRWLGNYLSGRWCRTDFRGSISTGRAQWHGVPQGAVLSPALFNLYMSDLPQHPDFPTVAYADDLTILAQGPVHAKLSRPLSQHLQVVADHLTAKHLSLSVAKCSVTLLTPDAREFNDHPQVKINGQLLPLDRSPKILGVNLDTMLKFGPHISRTVDKARKTLNVLRAVAGCDFGQDKETLIHTYRATTRAILEYGNAAWRPTISDTQLKKLERVELAALRVATGCASSTPTPHLYDESDTVVPLGKHSAMLTNQLAASATATDHPLHWLYNERPPPRRMRTTLIEFSASAIATARRHLPVGAATAAELSKRVHTDTVEEYLRARPPNNILQKRPPAISRTEQQLDRRARTSLAQLRCGHSPRLTSYMHRIGRSPTPQCPDCGATNHDTQHLFACSAHTTTLTIEDLWRNPSDCARFLDL